MDELCTCESREMTLIEEINNLPIEESVKNRISKKAMELTERCIDQNMFIQNCHNRIYWLEKACVELSLLIAKQKDGME